MVRAQRTQLTLVTAAFVAGTVAIACGGGGEKDPDPGAGGTTAGTAGGTTAGTGGGGGGKLEIQFNPMYSAFDGKHTFRLPVLVTGAKGKLTVTTSPADFVSYEPSPDGVMLTMRKAGDTTVTITDAEGNTGSAPLKVTENDPGDVDLGAERYANGVVPFVPREGGSLFPEGGFTFPEGGFDAGITILPDGAIQFPEGGFNIPEGGGRLPMRDPESACTFCHKPAGAPSAGGGPLDRIDVEHTPQQTGGYSDEEIIAIFTEAKKPEGSKWNVLPAAFAPIIYPTFHKWNVEENVKKGIVAYLRQLEPASQGEIDFSGFGRGGLGGGAAGGGAATMDAGTPAP
jgi:hypothetical protein